MCVVTFDWERNDAKKKFHSFERSKSVSWAILELTDHCNLNCRWCFANASRIKQPVHMDIKDVERIVNLLADVGVRQITYSGGEPTLYPHLKEAVSIASSHGMVVHMNTNGYLLTREMASELKNLGLSQVQINIDSIHAEKHDTVRGKEGSFVKAIQALRNAGRAGIMTVSNTVLTRDNEEEVVEIFKLARGMGIQRCRVWDMTPSHGCALENIHLIPKSYVLALQRLSDFAYETGARNVEVGEPIFMPHINTKLSVSGGYCVFAAGMAMYISRRGDVYFCCTSKNNMYNLFEAMSSGNDIRQVHEKGVKKHLSSFSHPEGCRSCEHLNICRGGCYTRREFSRNNMDYWCSLQTA